MSIGKKVISSSLLLVAVRFLQRTLGLISTLILARILIPEDFGIVAITAICVQFSEVLSNSGIKQYIPQKDDVNDDDLNTAWSIDLGLKFFMWIIVLLGAPLLADFYDNEKITSALQVVSIVILLRALQNPGLHLLRRNLSYSKIFWLNLWQKVASFIVVVVLALTLKSYWAMIIGDIVYAVVGIVGSYHLHSFRPKLSLTRYKEQLGFSKWMLGRGIVGFFRAQADQLMVSKIFGIGDLGIYNVVRGISILPATDIIVPSVEPLLASFARVKKDIQQLGHQLRASLLMIFLLIMPVCAFLVAFPDIVILVLLGEKWSHNAQLLGNLSILLVTFSLGSILGNFYVATGRVKLVFFYNIASLIFIVGMLLIFTGDTLADFALNRGIFGLISTLLWLGLALHFSESDYLRFAALILPPIATAFLSAYIVDIYSINISIVAFDLILKGIFFVALYTAIILAIYFCGYYRLKEWHHLKTLLVETIMRARGKEVG